MGLGPYTSQTGKAGCPGDGPDVRSLARGQMSWLKGWMSGLVEMAVLLSGWATPDVWAEGSDVRGFRRRRMSGVMTGCPGYRGSLLCSLDGASRCPGWRPDFR